MLVLSRKAGEKIHIGDNVVITVTRLQGNRVTIGIDAPSDVAIHRAEIVGALNSAVSVPTQNLSLVPTRNRDAIAS